MNELTEASLAVALRELGRTADRVARELARRKVRGKRDSLSDGPLSRYLAGLFPGRRFECCPVTERIQIDREGRAILPRACRDFLDDFDSGLYPGMVED